MKITRQKAEAAYLHEILRRGTEDVEQLELPDLRPPFPCSPILDGESATGWAIRSAAANRATLKPFFNVTLGYIGSRDLDVAILPGEVPALAVRTQRPEVEFAHIREFATARTRSARCEWIAGKKPKTSRDMAYCPECLATDAIPHFRIKWRLRFMMACDIHRRWLKWACPVCRRLISPLSCARGLLIFGDSALLARCTGCGADLRTAEGPDPPNTLMDEILALQGKLLKAFFESDDADQHETLSVFLGLCRHPEDKAERLPTPLFPAQSWPALHDAQNAQRRLF